MSIFFSCSQPVRGRISNSERKKKKRVYNYTGEGTEPTTLKKEITYTYDSVWKDKMVQCDGKTLTYDEIGNLTAFDYAEYQWKNGRQLSGYFKSGVSASYGYNHNGQRCCKTVGSVRTDFTYVGSLLARQKSDNLDMRFTYNTLGIPVALWYNGSEYYYVRNLQNDIIGLIDSTGEWVVEYSYDAWGKILNISGSLAATVGQNNPLRYRGYYYDNETGLYYVSSRYYHPELGRWISADTTDILDVQRDLYDKNLYAYCDNNPVMRKDIGGTFWITVGIMAVGGIIGAAIGAVGSAVSQYAFNGSIDLESVGVSAVSGFVSGAIAASPLGLGWQIGAGAVIGGTSYVADCTINKKPVKADELIVSIGAGAISGFVGGPGANQNMVLTNTIKTSLKTTTKLLSRNNAKYAVKRIAETKSWRNNILTVSALSSSVVFSAGTGISNIIPNIWSKVTGWISGFFR